MDLASPSERLENAEPALADSPLLGFVRSCPAADITAARPLQTASRIRCAFRRRASLCRKRHQRQPSAARFHTRHMFRPRGFSPPRRFAPRPTSRNSLAHGPRNRSSCFHGDSSGCFATRASRGSLRCQPPHLSMRQTGRNPPRPTFTTAEAKSEGASLAFPAARAPYEEPSTSAADNTSRCHRYPLEVAAQQVQTRRSYPTAWPSTGR